jgi:hypothetical protein
MRVVTVLRVPYKLFLVAVLCHFLPGLRKLNLTELRLACPSEDQTWVVPGTVVLAQTVGITV